MRKNRRFVICSVALLFSAVGTLSAVEKSSLNKSAGFAVADTLLLEPAVVVESETSPAIEAEKERQELVVNKEKAEQEKIKAENLQKKREQELEKREAKLEKDRKNAEQAELNAKKKIEKKEKELEKATQRREKEEEKERKRLENKEKQLQKEKKRTEKERTKAEKAKEKREKDLLKAEKQFKSKQKSYLKISSKIQKDKLRLEHKVRLGSISPIAELEAKEKIGKNELEAEKLTLEMDMLKAKIENLSAN